MKILNLDEMVRGWFVGDFEPTAFSTDAAEVGVKKYTAGDHEPAHYHKVSTEITAIISGEAKFNNTTYKAGDIITIEPNEIVEFLAVTDVVTVVVKVPHTRNDKYEV